MSKIGKWKIEFSKILMISLDWDVYRESARLFANRFPKYATRLRTSPNSSESLDQDFSNNNPLPKINPLIITNTKLPTNVQLHGNFFFPSEITWNYIEIWHNVCQHSNRNKNNSNQVNNQYSYSVQPNNHNDILLFITFISNLVCNLNFGSTSTWKAKWKIVLKFSLKDLELGFPFSNN